MMTQIFDFIVQFVRGVVTSPQILSQSNINLHLIDLKIPAVICLVFFFFLTILLLTLGFTIYKKTNKNSKFTNIVKI